MGIFGGDDKQNVQAGAVDSIIGEKAKFKGELVSDGSVSLNGEFEGEIISKGEVIIGRGSKMVGSVKGGSVVVSGKVEGNIIASQSLEIAKSGKVHGDLAGGKIVIEEGASYRGKVSVSAAGEAPEAEEIIEAEPEIAVAEKETSPSRLF
ncbi:MAG: polymer-forming cytoskeletal protein [Candidatus Margulisbacteria bacterium]|nr:polymer-forming cytoskeletal protein [Candidatus Margulisiibacteriota bacterium]